MWSEYINIATLRKMLKEKSANRTKLSYPQTVSQDLTMGRCSQLSLTLLRIGGPLNWDYLDFTEKTFLIFC